MRLRGNLTASGNRIDQKPKKDISFVSWEEGVGNAFLEERPKTQVLAFYAAERNALNDKFRKDQVNNNDREDRESDHNIYLPHIEFQEVRASKLRDQNRQSLLRISM